SLAPSSWRERLSSRSSSSRFSSSWPLHILLSSWACDLTATDQAGLAVRAIGRHNKQIALSSGPNALRRNRHGTTIRTCFRFDADRRQKARARHENHIQQHHQRGYPKDVKIFMQAQLDSGNENFSFSLLPNYTP